MPILRSETDLSVGDYADIPNSTGSMSAQITLQRYGPVWEDHPNDTDNGRGSENFDAILVGNYLIRAYASAISEVSVDYMPSEVSGISDASWVTVDATAIDDLAWATPASLVAGTSPLVRLFYVNTAGVVKYSENTDVITNAFGSPVVVCSPSDSVKHIAATSTTRVHYITKTSSNNMRLHYANYDGSWSTVSGDVYWPFIVHGFDAIALDSDTDLLVIATDIAPLIGSRCVGTEVQTEVNRVQALVCFEVKNGRWSDWLPADVIDRVPSSYPEARDVPRISYHNDLVFVTYGRAGGDGEYEYTYPAVARSADGSDWEYPELVPDADTPYVVLPRDDYLYAVGVSGTLRSPKCAWAGQDPVEYDVTSYVLGTQSQAAEIRNSGVNLANPSSSTTDVFQGVLSGDLPLSDSRLQLKYELGYWLDGTARRVHVSTEDVIQRVEQRGLPNLNLALTSQDYLGRVNRVRSDYAAEWPSMQCGRDSFEDTTGTGYGGMRHMAPIKPSFKASEGILKLISNNKEGIAISTFVSDTLCGSAQTSIDLIYDTESERQGIVFHVFDKDNLYYCAYYPDNNYFKLVKRTGVVDGDVNFTDTTLATSDTIASWNTTRTDKHWMKILVRYNKFILYRSDNGITWTAVTWSGAGFKELPGYKSRTDTMWSGRFGVAGYGYSDEDVEPVWKPTPWPPPVIPPSSNQGVAVLCSDQIAISYDFFDVTVPTWYDLDPSNDLAGVFQSMALTDDGRAYVTTRDDASPGTVGLFYCSDVTLAETGEISWELLKTAAEAQAATGFGGGKDGTFGSVYVNDNNEVCALVHSGGNNSPDAGETSGAYIGSDGVVTLSLFGFPVPTRPFFAHSPNNSALHSVFGTTTDWYVAGTAPTLGGQLAVGDPDGWVFTNFTSVATLLSATGGATTGYVVDSDNDVYEGWSPGSPIAGLKVQRALGIAEDDDGEHRLYVGADDADYDLYQDGVLVGNASSASTGFGVGALGSMGAYRRDSTEMVWILGDNQTFSTHRVVIYSSNDGANWINKTGNLRAALGSPLEWSGWTGNTTGNSVVRVFRY